MKLAKHFPLFILFLPAIIIYIIASILLPEYFPANIAYLVLILVLSKANLHNYLKHSSLRHYWEDESNKTKTFVFLSATFKKPTVTATPADILKDENISKVTRLKHLVDEIEKFLKSFQTDLETQIFRNSAILLGFIILSSGIQSKNIKTDLSDQQIALIRLAVSYLTVTVQLIWFVRLLFHYRQKIADTLPPLPTRSDK